MAAKRTAGRTSCNPWDMRFPLCVGRMWDGTMFSSVCALPSPASAEGMLPFVVRLVHWCRVGGGALARWPPSAAQTARTVFPYAAFTKTQLCRETSEGISPTRFTSPYSRYSAAVGSCFQPPFRQRLNRCDQMRRTIHRSKRLKSFRTWARL